MITGFRGCPPASPREDAIHVEEGHTYPMEVLIGEQPGGHSFATLLQEVDGRITTRTPRATRSCRFSACRPSLCRPKGPFRRTATMDRSGKHPPSPPKTRRSTIDDAGGGRCCRAPVIDPDLGKGDHSETRVRKELRLLAHHCGLYGAAIFDAGKWVGERFLFLASMLQMGVFGQQRTQMNPTTYSVVTGFIFTNDWSTPATVTFYRWHSSASEVLPCDRTADSMPDCLTGAAVQSGSPCERHASRFDADR